MIHAILLFEVTSRWCLNIVVILPSPRACKKRESSVRIYVPMSKRRFCGLYIYKPIPQWHPFFQICSSAIPSFPLATIVLFLLSQTPFFCLLSLSFFLAFSWFLLLTRLCAIPSLPISIPFYTSIYYYSCCVCVAWECVPTSIYPFSLIGVSLPFSYHE